MLFCSSFTSVEIHKNLFKGRPERSFILILEKNDRNRAFSGHLFENSFIQMSKITYNATTYRFFYLSYFGKGYSNVLYFKDLPQ